MSGGADSRELVERCAIELARAEAARLPIEPLTKTHPKLGIDDAYAIQRANMERRVGLGERVVGHKIGLTARAMQELFKVNEPDFGQLLDTMMHDSRQPLDLATLIDPQVEVEPAFVLGRRLRGPGVEIDGCARRDRVRAGPASR